MRKNRFAALLLLISALLIIYLVKLETSYLSSSRTLANYDFSGFNNTVGSRKLLVPNIIHFIIFDKTDVDFVMFVCMLSAWLNHRPSQLMLHTNVKMEEKSKYLTVLRSVIGDGLVIQHLPQPSHVFGVKLAIVHHAADVARLQVLSKYGGIYLDWDVFVVKSLNSFRHYECAIGWPEGAYIGNQVIVAHKNARFLKLWLQSYRDYHPSEWYYNGGEVPTKQILVPRPGLVHRVYTEFGVEALDKELYQQNWQDYSKRYTIHLLASHKYLHDKAVLTEEEYNKCNCTFATLVNSVISQIADEQLSVLNNAALEDKLTKYLNNQIQSNSLLKKHLTPEILADLKHQMTSSFHSTIFDVVKTGLSNPDSSVGVLVPDTESYHTFKSLLLPIIKDYHHLPEDFVGQPNHTWGNVNTIGKFGSEVISTRIRIARSIAGYPLNSKMTKQNLIDLEQTVRSVLEQNFAGTYHSLPEMTEEFRKDLVDRHFMFEDCDRFNKGGGGCQHWPTGRGIYISNDEKFLVWINEEDHLRIISMDKGGDLFAIYKRLVESMNILESHLKFAHDPYYGFLTFCPTNIGTTLRASVHLKFNNLKQSEVKNKAKQLGLQVRGTHGEHSDVKGGIMDISNARRLGLTEYEAINQVYTGVNKILDLDRQGK